MNGIREKESRCNDLFDDGITEKESCCPSVDAGILLTLPFSWPVKLYTTLNYSNAWSSSMFHI